MIMKPKLYRYYSCIVPSSHVEQIVCYYRVHIPTDTVMFRSQNRHGWVTSMVRDEKCLLSSDIVSRCSKREANRVTQYVIGRQPN